MGQTAEVIQREFIYVWYYFTVQLRQIFWYYVLGIVLGSVVSVFVKDRIHGLFRSMGNKKLGALKIVLGIRRFLLYLAFVMAFSLVTGLIVNQII